jgi:hypothetical protein
LPWSRLISLISAGCSHAPSETRTGSSGGNKNATNHEKAVKFAGCMRDNGVREFPDPDASGHDNRSGVRSYKDDGYIIRGE